MRHGKEGVQKRVKPLKGFTLPTGIKRAKPASGYCGRRGTSQRFHMLSLRIPLSAADGAVREAAAVAAPQHTLLGEVDKILLAAFGSRTAYVTAVGLHYPLATVGFQLTIEYRAQFLAQLDILDRYHHLDAAFEITFHAVGRAD